MNAYELRIYHIAAGKMEALRTLMQEVMVPLMGEYAMEAVSFFATQDDTAVYWLVAHNSHDGVAADWDRFHADPRWMDAIRRHTQGTSFLTGQQSIHLRSLQVLPPQS